MTNQGIDIQDAKLRGEWAEMRFMARAAEHGLSVSKPWGDSARYDFAVEHHGRFLRIQVKCTKCKSGRLFKCNISSRGIAYAMGEIDFFAAYVIPSDMWFLLPFTAVNGKKVVLLSINDPSSKYAGFIEAWELLQGPKLR